ncbi:MAG: DsbA family protein [Pseudomonadota bacterium]
MIEYYYSAHSAYAYLGAPRLREIAAAHGETIAHRPFDLMPVVDAVSGGYSGARTDAHRAYFFEEDMYRWAAYRGLPMQDFRPTHHDEPLALASGAILASEDPWAAHWAVLRAHWEDDINVNDPADLERAGLDPAAISRAMDPDIQALFQEATMSARARPIFGSPTYIWEGKMFYGQDRLELLDHALGLRG